MLEKIKRALERWERGERLDDRSVEELAEEFEAWLEAELKEITELADGGQGNEALGRLTRVNAFAASAASVRPSLATALSTKAAVFTHALESVAKALGAVDFSITLGVPMDLSFTLTFVVSKPGVKGPLPVDTDGV